MIQIEREREREMYHTTSLAITTADTSSSSDRIEWSRPTILDFIEDYRKQRVLWDPNTKGYHIKQTKYEALKTLGSKYGTEIRSIRSKIKSLRSSFHREHGKVINGRRKGVHYQPMWFAYEAIRFILDGESTATAETATSTSMWTLTSTKQHNKIKSHGEKVKEEVEEKLDLSNIVNEEKNLDGGGGDEDLADLEGEEEEYESDSELANELKIATALNLTPTTLTIKAETKATAVVGNVNIPTQLLPATSSSSSAAAAAAIKGSSLSSTKNASSVNADENNSIVIARVASMAAAATAAAAAANGTDDFAVIHSKFESDLQSYCNIRAEDVKTEIIETDSVDLSLPGRTRTLTPSPMNAYKMPMNDLLIPNRKRKSQPHHLCERIRDNKEPTPSKQPKIHQQQTREMPNTIVPISGISTIKSATVQTDEYGVFGEYVAITIRKLKTSKSKIAVKHLINNLLYEAELGKYDHGIPSSKEPPQLYKM